MLNFLITTLILVSYTQYITSFRILSTRTQQTTRNDFTMEVKNDPFAKANREMRRASADDRMVELKKPMGIELDEDQFGNVFIKSIEKNSRAEKTGQIFVGDYG